MLLLQAARQSCWLETRFDIQLEGDADIWFRRAAGSAAEVSA
jgi:hypothetical protein